MSWSKGYMPGGFNFFASSGGLEENSFEPQKSKNYEIGVKGSFDRLRLSASVFYMDIEDIHVYRANGNIYTTSNAREAHSQGIELEMAYKLTKAFELSGAFGVIDAKYDDYDYGAGDFEGKHIENAPSHMARIGLACRNL